MTAKPTTKQKLQLWFATSPLATAARVGIGAALVWILDNIAAFDLNPTVAVGVVAAVSAALRWFNPADTAYGRKAE